MKNFIMLLLALTLAGSASAQQPKPVSRYMRDIGILYLEQVESLPLTDCGIMSDCRHSWEATLDSMQDRIDITLSEAKRPAGDAPYRDLLLKVRYARSVYTLAFSNKDDNRMAWMGAYSGCEARAHTVALDGAYRDEGAACDDEIDAVIHPENVEKKKVAATLKECKAGRFDRAYCEDYIKKHPQP